MASEWKNQEGQMVARRFWGGSSRGVVVQVQVPAEQWEACDVVVSEGGQEVPRGEVVRNASVVPWSRFAANSEAVAWQRAAQQWASHPSVAHACAAQAQRCKEDAHH